MEKGCPKISIIVPVYKVEKYLSKCIESILNQTLKNFELLLIDDGSPDNSGIICDEYALKDNRIKVIHKENGGVSSARNYGLNIAKGKYVGFVDADDWIEPDMYEKILSAIEDLDDNAFCICGIKVINEFGEEIRECEGNDVIYFNAEELITRLYSNFSPIRRVCWNKVFNKKIIDGLRFDENLAYEEDTKFLLSYIKRINNVIYIQEGLYINLMREDSASRNNANVKIAMESIYSQIEDLELIKNEYSNLYSNVFAYIADNWLYKLIYYSKDCPKDKKYLIKQSAKDVLKYYPQVLKNRNLTFKYKLIWLLRVIQIILG